MPILVYSSGKRLKRKQPLFSRGKLVYEESSHALTYNKGYYICSKKCKGNCSLVSEKKIKTVNFDRKFTRFVIDNFLIPENNARDLFYEISRVAVDIKESVEREIRPNREVLGATIECMKKDLRKKKTLNQRDIKEVVSQYYKMLKISFPSFLIDLMQNSVEVFSVKKIITPTFAEMIDKLYIKNDGRMLKLKLDGFPSYFLQYLSFKIPGYAKNLKIPFVNRIYLPSLEPRKAIDFFKKNSYRQVTSFSMFASKNAERKQKEGLYTSLAKAKPEYVIEYTEFLMDQLWREPIAQFSNTYKFDKGSDLLKKPQFNR